MELDGFTLSIERIEGCEKTRSLRSMYDQLITLPPRERRTVSQVARGPDQPKIFFRRT